LRRDLDHLVTMLSPIKGVDDVTLTTNGSVLARYAQRLADAGLKRITVSLDSLDDATFMRLNDASFPVATVLSGIAAAVDAGLAPIKVNMVVRRGVNETSVLPMARWARDEGHILRFIEYMDVGHTNGWRMDDVVPASEMLAQIDAEMPIEAVPPRYRGEVATRWSYRDGNGEVGLIASVTQPFCGDCTRARLTADGQLYTCLFANNGHDLRLLVRGGADDAAIAARLEQVWVTRDDRYSELRTAATRSPSAKRLPALPIFDPSRVEMSRIGG
jgi:cyclic pyranopterin phosphate synthase